MPTMLMLMHKPLAAARDEDAMRAGRRTRLPLRSTSQRAALLGLVRGRRLGAPRRPAHA
jgi:hypothetical protein